jgi:hypothetical protein
LRPIYQRICKTLFPVFKTFPFFAFQGSFCNFKENSVVKATQCSNTQLELLNLFNRPLPEEDLKMIKLRAFGFACFSNFRRVVISGFIKS